MRPLPLSNNKDDDTAKLIQQRLENEFNEEVILYYLPLRINENHWIDLYVNRTNGNPIIYWIDPYGGLSDTRKNEIINILNDTAIFDITLTNDHIHFQEIPLQQDDFNCGPWIVEIFRFIRINGRLPTLLDNINDARVKQEKTLERGREKSQYRSTSYVDRVKTAGGSPLHSLRTQKILEAPETPTVKRKSLSSGSESS